MKSPSVVEASNVHWLRFSKWGTVGAGAGVLAANFYHPNTAVLIIEALCGMVAFLVPQWFKYQVDLNKNRGRMKVIKELADKGYSVKFRDNEVSLEAYQGIEMERESRQLPLWEDRIQ